MHSVRWSDRPHWLRNRVPALISAPQATHSTRERVRATDTLQGTVALVVCIAGDRVKRCRTGVGGIAAHPIVEGAGKAVHDATCGAAGVTQPVENDAWPGGVRGGRWGCVIASQRVDRSPYGAVNNPSSAVRTTPSPFPTLPDTGALFGVTCLSVASCWAVGFTQTPADIKVGATWALLEHYTGTTWAIAGTPHSSPG